MATNLTLVKQKVHYFMQKVKLVLPNLTPNLTQPNLT